MKILVERIKETPTPLAWEAAGAWLEEARGRMPELAGCGPLALALRAHRMGEDLLLEGELRGELELGCSRCLSRYRHALREPFRLVLEPAGTRIPAEPEEAAALVRHGVCVGDELEAGWFRGHEIDLSAHLLELVALALPVKPLCREECAGLCPRCGADRNGEPCGCAERPADSPFAVLERLRGSLGRGET